MDAEKLIDMRIGKYERDLARHHAPSQPDGVCRCGACVLDRAVLAELQYMKMAARELDARGGRGPAAIKAGDRDD